MSSNSLIEPVYFQLNQSEISTRALLILGRFAETKLFFFIWQFEYYSASVGKIFDKIHLSWINSLEIPGKSLSFHLRAMINDSIIQHNFKRFQPMQATCFFFLLTHRHSNIFSNDMPCGIENYCNYPNNSTFGLFFF